jgi:hypothetical protein
VTLDGPPTSATGSKSISPNLLLKAMAVLLLYVLIGHPSAYTTLWRDRNWYVLLSGVIVGPILLVWSVHTLIWRIRLGPRTISIRGVGRVMERPYEDVSQVERKPGQLVVVFRGGSRRAIPAIVGDLDDLHRDIESRRTARRQP